MNNKELAELIEELIYLAGEHNPQHPEMELLHECPEGDERCCGHCDVIHQANRFVTELVTEQEQVTEPESNK